MILSSKSLINVPSVLAVDDNPDNVELISYVLDAINIKCYGVNDSRSVLDLAVDLTPKLIILDIVMPNMSGFDVLRQLKANIFTKNIPVIAVTGLVSIDHQAKIQSAGFDGYICKPFILEELEGTIVEHLNFSLVKSVA